MKKWIAFLMVVAAVSFAAIALAGDEPMAAAPSEGAAVSHPQTMCPVMNSAITKSKYVDYNGKRVYFCCGSCVKAFKADPEKYMKKLQDEGVTLEDAPTK